MTSSAASDARSDRPESSADLKDVARSIHEEFDDRLDPLEVDACLVSAAAIFADAKIRAFVPLLVQRHVRTELRSRLVPALH